MSSQWLEEHLDDPAVRVIEVDVSAAAHDEGHIPGSVLWNIYTDLKDEKFQPQPMSVVEQLIRASGITEDSIVVFYGYGPAFGFWLMKLCGHADVRILDTDRETWLSDGRPWATDTTVPAPSTYQLRTEVDSIRASQRSVENSIGSEHHTILDVRSELEHRGERFWPSGGSPEGGRAGRVPSSVQLPADGLIGSNGSFLSAAVLSEVVASVNVDMTSQLTTYCTIGARAATVWFVLTYILGYQNVRVYDGSWVQWGLSPFAPIERGGSPTSGALRTELGLAR